LLFGTVVLYRGSQCVCITQSCSNNIMHHDLHESAAAENNVMSFGENWLNIKTKRTEKKSNDEELENKIRKIEDGSLNAYV